MVEARRAENFAGCKIFNGKDFSIANQGIHLVRSHQAGKNHMDAMKSLSQLQTSLAAHFVASKSNPSEARPAENVISPLENASTNSIETSLAQKEKSVSIQLPLLPPANLRESITKAEILFALK